MIETTYAQRLGSLIGDEPGRVMSIRAFAEAMRARKPRPPGSTRAMIHRYLKGDGPEPAPEFTRAAADILGVRPAWLAFEDGEVTWDLQYRRYSADVPDDERRPWTRDEKAAHDLWLEFHTAVTELGLNGGLVEEVMQSYFYSLHDHRDGAPANADGIARLLRSRFPRTVSAYHHLGPGAASDVILFSEAATANAFDLLAVAPGSGALTLTGDAPTVVISEGGSVSAGAAPEAEKENNDAEA